MRHETRLRAMTEGATEYSWVECTCGYQSRHHINPNLAIRAGNAHVRGKERVVADQD